MKSQKCIQVKKGSDSGKKWFHSKAVNGLYIGVHLGSLVNMKTNTFFFFFLLIIFEGLELLFKKGNSFWKTLGLWNHRMYVGQPKCLVLAVNWNSNSYSFLQVCMPER